MTGAGAPHDKPVDCQRPARRGRRGALARAGDGRPGRRCAARAGRLPGRGRRARAGAGLVRAAGRRRRAGRERLRRRRRARRGDPRRHPALRLRLPRGHRRADPGRRSTPACRSASACSPATRRSRPSTAPGSTAPARTRATRPPGRAGHRDALRGIRRGADLPDDTSWSSQSPGWTTCGRRTPYPGAARTDQEARDEDVRGALRRAQREGARPGRRARAPCAALDAGVHAIGKKLVEEAAESWMAAEHEGAGAAAEELSQLLYHAQVMMLACGLTLDDVYATSDGRLPGWSHRARKDSCCSGSRYPTRARCRQAATEMLREAGYKQRRDTKDLTLTDADNGVEFFYLRPRDIASTSARARSTSASPAATCCSTRAPRPRRSCRSASAGRTFRFAGAARHGRPVKRPGRQADRHVVRRGRRGLPGRARRRRRPSSASTARSSRPFSSASRT